MNFLMLLLLALIVTGCCITSEGYAPWCQTNSPLWKKIGMAISENNQYDEDQYILEELNQGNNNYLYRVTYTYGTVPPVWYLEGSYKASNNEVRTGYNPGLKSMLPGSIPGIMRQALPRFRLLIPEGFALNCGKNAQNFNWKKVGTAAPDYNHYTKDLYEVWEQNAAPNYYRYKVTYKFTELPVAWILEGTHKATDGEIRQAEYRQRSNGFLKYKLNLNNEGFTPYPGKGLNPWTQLSSAGYKGTAWNGHGNVPPPDGTGWYTIGRAGMYLSTGRPVYYNYVVQEAPTKEGYKYRIYNPDNVDFAGVTSAGPLYINLKGNEKIRNLDIREALPSSLSLELPGFYKIKFS